MINITIKLHIVPFKNLLTGITIISGSNVYFIFKKKIQNRIFFMEMDMEKIQAKTKANDCSIYGFYNLCLVIL